MKRTYLLGILVLFFLFSTTAFASDMFSDIEDKCIKLEQITNECDLKSIPCVYEKTRIAVMKQFIIYGREDLANGNTDRASYVLDCLTNIADETETALNTIDNRTSIETVDLYDGSALTSNICAYQDASADLKFFSGYVIPTLQLGDITKYAGIGADFMQLDLNSSDFIIKPSQQIAAWDFDERDDVEVSTCTDQKASGTHSLKVVSTLITGPEKYSRIYQTVCVRPSTQYTISFSVRSLGMSKAKFYYNGWNQSIAIDAGTYNWRKKTITFTTADTQTYLDIFFLIQSSGKLWLDDVNVVETSKSLDCICNGGFEIEQTGELLVNDGAINTRIASVMADAKSAGIAVNIMLSPHYVPDWLFDLYPDAYCYQEGFLKCNIDSTNYKSFMQKFIQVTIGEAYKFTNLHSVSISNEPMYNTTYATKGTFLFYDSYIGWLKERYGEGNGVNIPSQMAANWNVSSSTKWADVSFPYNGRVQSTGSFYDWMEYNNHEFTEFHKWMTDCVHSVSTTISVSAKITADAFKRDNLNKGIDYEALYSYFDYNGFDGGPSSCDTASMLNIRMYEDFVNSISNKPGVNSENHLFVDGYKDYSDKVSGIANADLWQGFIHGRSASAAWIWHRETENEYYTDSVASRPDVVLELADRMLDANRLSEDVFALQNTERNFYILYSVPSLLYNEDSYISVVNNTYNALISLGQRASFITENQIATGSLNKDDILIIPNATHIKSSTSSALNNFMGRIIVIGDKPSYDQYNNALSLDIKNQIAIENDEDEITSLIECLTEVEGYSMCKVTSNGQVMNNVDVRVTVINGKMLINICNYSEEDIASASIDCNENIAKTGYDEISCENVDLHNLSILSNTPMLISVDAFVGIQKISVYKQENGVKLVNNTIDDILGRIVSENFDILTVLKPGERFINISPQDEVVVYNTSGEKISNEY